MNISSKTPIQQVTSLHEASSLTPLRDTQSPTTWWKKITELVKGVNTCFQLINQLSRELTKLEGERKVTDFNYYPFKIYTLSALFRPTSDTDDFTVANNWRTVRIRGGLVLTTTVSTGSLVNGTDLMEKYSYNNFIAQPNSADYDIEIPLDTPQYWFWIEDSGSLAGGSPGGPYYLRYDDDPTSSGDDGNPNGWDNFPSASNSYIPIGYADTATSGSQNILFVRQMLTADVISNGGGSGSMGWNWQGIYDDTLFYSYQSVVLKNSLDSQGLWLCIQTSGSFGVDPVYPPPSATSGSADTWQLISFAPQNFQFCNNSAQYIQGQ